MDYYIVPRLRLSCKHLTHGECELQLLIRQRNMIYERNRMQFADVNVEHALNIYRRLTDRTKLILKPTCVSK
jgi:hypothetical protein